ncbi:MAG: FG-GAP repeat protein [Phycisphaerales bacterium]|nr:MAG: FG-GAP repeat protein [Phycisphaerales bacterium]
MLFRNAVTGVWVAGTCICLAAVAYPARAQCENAKLVASDATYGDSFGMAVSISGEYAIIGAPQYDGPGHGNDDVGAAYVFQRTASGWAEVEKLTASDYAALDEFGRSVSIHGDLAIVGVEAHDDPGPSAGTAFIFWYDGENWMEDVKLTASDAADYDHFGVSVAAGENRVVVGAHYDDDGESNSGSVYLFEWADGTWSEEAKLNANDAGNGDRFGQVISLSGDYILIGAPEDDDPDAGSNAGSAYVFHRSGIGWTQEDKLIASDASAMDYFGTTVALSGSLAVVGAHREDDSCGQEGLTDCGAAYVFGRNGSQWVEEAKLIADDTYPGQWFGQSVATDGESILVGAQRDNHSGTNSGASYVFARNGESWYQQTKLTDTQASYNDVFGCSVAIEGATALVGAEGDYVEAIRDRSGSAFVFTRLGGKWDIGLDDLDLLVFMQFQTCFSGDLSAEPESCCSTFDCDADGDVDLEDFADCLHDGFGVQTP